MIDRDGNFDRDWANFDRDRDRPGSDFDRDRDRDRPGLSSIYYEFIIAVICTVYMYYTG